jgi:hypothetical protein
MQYWIFYHGGVGGDGFGCMLEHANNIAPADGVLEWRFHAYSDDNKASPRPIRFYQAHWASDPLPFRSSRLPENTVLNPVYVDIVEQGQNTIITAHHGYFDQIDQFEYRSIVEKDQVKIHLYSNRSERVYNDFNIKRGAGTTLQQFSKLHQWINKGDFARRDYDIHIDIEQVWRNWNYTKECMEKLSIDLPKEVYDQYLTYIDNLE